jgi:hypothetical protein
MLTSDMYGKTLSTYFDTASSSIAQKVKPKIIIQWLDSRHLDNLTVTTNDAHSNTAYPNLGFYFDKTQAFNGIERQSFTWAVCDAKDKNGKTITADGTWYAMPSLLSNDLSNTHIGSSLEFGWWSNSVSNSSLHGTYSGYGFVTDPYVEATFTTRKINRIRIVTSELYGQISNYLLDVYDGSSNLILSEAGVIRDGYYYQDHILSTALSTQNFSKIRLTIRSTKNPQDRARVQEIIPIYETDVTDYVIDYSTNRVRDVHSTSLPVGGSETAQASITLDNTNKDFNVFNTSSLYGPYMVKDLKVKLYTGWRIKKLEDDNDIYANTQLSSSISNSSMTLNVLDTGNFPTGGSGNYFTVYIDKGNQSEELILCSVCPTDKTITVIERGYNGTLAKAHSQNAVVSFEIYEYVSHGTFYVDEWSASSSAMTVSINLNDWSKYLVEKTINTGFFLDSVTVGDAVSNLLMRANFPSSDIRKLNIYSSGARQKGAIANYSFNEETIDRSGNNIVPSTGLRSRFWGMPSGGEINVKDILADAIDKVLTPTEKGLGMSSFTSPDYVALSKSISSPTTSALQISNYTFTGTNGTTYTTYYNGVFDGYYIPKTTGSQYLIVKIKYGGVRLYLDDNLIIDQFNHNPTTGGTLNRYSSAAMTLTAGVPYKIRIEFFHSYNSTSGASFSIELYKAVGFGADTIVPASECYTIIPLDSVGSRDALFASGSTDRNKNRNNGVYIASPSLGQTTGLTSEPDNKAVLLSSNSYIRIPYHLSMDLSNSSSSMYTGDWSFETFVKFNAGSFAGTGEYISNWSNSAPTTGFEFFNTSSSNGFKIRTLVSSTVTTETVSSTTALSNSAFYHLTVTYDAPTLKYYVNGSLAGTTTLAGTPISWASKDITIGGRGASYTSGTGEVAPSTFREFIIDEFAIYNKALSSTEVADRYSESNIQPLTVFPFLYGNEDSIRGIIDSITLADFGRLYVDEEDKARYEHFYRFFEPSIPQHANIQHTISDDTSIIDADIVVSLQCNKITIPIAGVASIRAGTQSLWRAPDPTTLSAVTLTANMTTSSDTIYVDTTENPPFPTIGYLKIANEIIKYTSKTANSFKGVTRAQFQTTAATHTINDGNNSKVREVKYFNLKYDKAPAFNIKPPFITSIAYEDPAQIEIVRYIPGPYGAELLIATANTVASGTIVFAEGTNPFTERVSFASIAGTPVIVTDQQIQQVTVDPSLATQTASISDSIRKYGLKDIVIESPYISDADHAKKIADFIISKTKDSVPIININSIVIPKLQLGDRIRISNMSSFDIINADYWVISQGISVSDNLSHTMTLRKVV